MHRENISRDKPQSQHGDNRAHHRIPHVVRRTQDIRHGERGRPQEDRAAVVDHNQRHAERKRLRRHAVNLEDKRRARDRDKAGARGNGVGDHHQLFRHAARLRLIARADALPDNRNHRQAHRLTRNDGYGIQIIRQRIRGNLGRAEQRDHAHDEHAAKLKQAVFQTVRHTDLQNAADQLLIRSKPLSAPQRDRVLGVQQQNRDSDSRRAARQHGRKSRASNAPLEHENEQRVADEVDDVDQSRNQHGDTRVALCAEQRRTGVVDRQNGVGEHADRQVGERALHHIVLDRAEQQAQQRCAEQHDERRDDQRNDRDD